MQEHTPFRSFEEIRPVSLRSKGSPCTIHVCTCTYVLYILSVILYRVESSLARNKNGVHTLLSIGLLPSVAIIYTSNEPNNRFFTLHQLQCSPLAATFPPWSSSKTLSACIKQLLQSAGPPSLASDIASSPPLLLCTRTCIDRTAKNL